MNDLDRGDGVSIDIDAITLARGAHRTRDDGMCLLEAVAHIAGEPHTDHPKCVCPVLGAFGRRWNDALEDEDRNRLLKPFVPLLVGTRSTPAVEQQRGFLAADWLVRVCAPVWLRAAQLEDEAAALEGLAPLLSVEACVAARPVIDRAKGAAEAAREAARDAVMAAAWADDAAAATAATKAAAGTAARDAVMAAAWADDAAAATAATKAAAGTAARDAAVSIAIPPAAFTTAAAAVVAARDTATYAAMAAARNAATVDAADAAVALRPHVEQLQTAAVDLYRQMIEVAP